MIPVSRRFQLTGDNHSFLMVALEYVLLIYKWILGSLGTSNEVLDDLMSYLDC